MYFPHPKIGIFFLRNMFVSYVTNYLTKKRSLKQTRPLLGIPKAFKVNLHRVIFNWPKLLLTLKFFDLPDIIEESVIKSIFFILIPIFLNHFRWKLQSYHSTLNQLNSIKHDYTHITLYHEANEYIKGCAHYLNIRKTNCRFFR